MHSRPLEEKFQKAIEISNLASINNFQNVQIDAEKLLEVRDSRECKQFREWLSTVKDIDDELPEHCNAFNSKLGKFIRSTTGKSLRFAISTAAGFFPGGIAFGPTVGAIDTFLLEKIIPAPGPLSFISNLYPSIYQKR